MTGNRQSPAILNDEYLSAMALAERGWTPAMVRALLDPPDATKPNPKYRSAAPMRLYALARVEATEGTDEFRDRQRAACRRAAMSRAVADRHRAETMDRIKASRVEVPLLGWDELVERAVAHRNHRNFEYALERGEDTDPAAADEVDDTTLVRWSVNYLRHALSDYDRLLDQLTGATGKADGRRDQAGRS
jgi:hypothetical protein